MSVTGTRNALQSSDELTREEKLEQLEKVLQSRNLHGSESLRAFLRFVVLKAVDHQEGDLKEYTIATEVFGRNNNYDPRSDSVVRVQAGRLRSKLHEYYEGEGKADKVLIDLPKGHYAPMFSARPEAEIGQVSQIEIGPAAEEKSPPKGNWIRLALAVSVILLVAAIVVATKYRGDASRLSESLGTKTEEYDLQALGSLWGDFFRSSEPILLVFSNTLFEGTAETGMKLVKPWDSPVPSSGSPAGLRSSESQNQKTQVLTEHYTGTGEVMGAFFLGDLFARMDRPLRVKRSLLLNWEDLKTTNIVVLGSPAENYLLRNLPQEQDFLFRSTKDQRGNTTFGLVNTKARPGEQEFYLATQEGPSRSQIAEDYALISMLQGLEADRRLLILAGVTTFGTQAAAEYVTKPEYIKELTANMNTAPPGEPPQLPAYYQVVIKVKVNGGVPVHLSYVTHHALR
jgi:hypothetical protein